MEKRQIAQPTEAFATSVESIRNAEAEAEEIARKANERAERLLAAAREKAVEIGVKAADASVRGKNAIIAKGRAETAKSVSSIIRGTARKCEKIAAKKLSEPDASELASKIQI